MFIFNEFILILYPNTFTCPLHATAFFEFSDNKKGRRVSSIVSQDFEVTEIQFIIFRYMSGMETCTVN